MFSSLCIFMITHVSILFCAYMFVFIIIIILNLHYIIFHYYSLAFNVHHAYIIEIIAILFDYKLSPTMYSIAVRFALAWHVHLCSCVVAFSKQCSDA